VGAYLTGIISREELHESMRLVLSQSAAPQAETELITRHTLRENRNTPDNHDIPHILVVDDDFVNRVLAEEVLKNEGWRVSIAENGEQALDLLASQQIDLVLMDMQMPVMDGFTAIGKIRTTEQSTGKHLPIIALTGFAFPEDQERCLTAGADEYLNKPFKPEELVAMVRQRLQQRK
jgi:CheY-like chemotaxis protein